MSSEEGWHSHREPDASTRRFADGASFVSWRDELRAALEVTVFQDGTVYLACPRIVSERGRRLVVPDTALMCHDMDEAKDAVDLILDRLRAEAAVPPGSGEQLSGDDSERADAEPVTGGLAGILARLECEPPVDGDALAELVRHVSRTYATALPDDYIAFLRSANGADGTLEKGAPVLFWKAELLAQVNADFDTEHRMPGLLVIGSDTGDYVYGIDLRADAPADRYVETEDVSMAWDYVLWRGPSLRDLFEYVDRP